MRKAVASTNPGNCGNICPLKKIDLVQVLFQKCSYSKIILSIQDKCFGQKIPDNFACLGNYLDLKQFLNSRNPRKCSIVSL